MTIAESLTKLSTDISAAYNAVASKGGTVPTNKNTDNLATAINSIDGGGSTPEDDPYVVPEFDGGEYGTVAYLNNNNEIAYYSATSESDLNITNALSQGNYIVKELPNGESIPSTRVLAYSFGSNAYNSPDTDTTNMFYGMYNLRRVYGLESRAWTQLGSYMFYICRNFNQPIVLPPNLSIIGDNIFNGCVKFNSPITFPESLTTIDNAFLMSCTLFNQPITLGENLNYIGPNFLRNCASFNSPLQILSPSWGTGDNFLLNCTAFNQPLNLSSLRGVGISFLSSATSFNQPIDFSANTLLTQIPASFLSSCTSFNSAITLPSQLKRINDSFLSSCSNFNQPITIPASVTYVGPSFMSNEISFLGPLTLLTTAHPIDASSLTLYTSMDTAFPPSILGVKLTGSGAQTWKDALPDFTYESDGAQRKLVVES